ncbi:NHLP bacteriocin system secretion protein [Sporomusa malonica]|uniref:NHLM bacteriocin system secretion protein n=1 Tax=Sporomusa malonica TaxID=112901 RepID=A0A1W2CY40_9FIRM|nr:NHLP bacteriocin system secretion protein [Sporomusa malonica]SMC90141.1 NHLM bacteriocin system secretion protein [Sporomusa malonica]
MNEGLFRKAALDKISSPDQLDQLITVTSPRGWIALATLGVLLLAAILWGIFGSIVVKVNSTGMLLTPGGIANIVHTADGQVTEVYVAPGSIVRAGQVIATVSQPSITAEIERLRSETALTQNQPDNAGRMVQQKQLQQQLAQASQVVSAVSGQVVEVKAVKGDFIRAGTSLVSVKTGEEGGKLAAVLYLSAEDGKKISPGLEVHIAPSTVRSEEYGFLVGKITSVSEYPVTSEKMQQALGSKELVQKFSKESNGAPIEVRAELIPDKTPSGYLWTSLTGPGQEILGGTVCSASVVVKRQRPITMVFLQLNQLLRSE